MVFRQVFAVLQFFLTWKLNSELGFEFLIKFYIDYSGLHIIFIHFHFYVVEETQIAQFSLKTLFWAICDKNVLKTFIKVSKRKNVPNLFSKYYIPCKIPRESRIFYQN